ncbi:uncharacterized protein BP01DRAFT_358101 [Aspergillus saccharolyticus JOP 1030-1]|uniref:Uncharacterized protein n=1 Tax=Aspergillus saccharolyticus JOP 1030-1 TaxID=1450539 RepID=A0A318Z964_9EURO|nr:hypothetical protein BP01DRAFT_358101 [Aspergillus saccharolyticus JOP 1030-1]PYH43931.1 hypothetical protein BP01DRAFT_358101 [Aspergillus saccharolyticus JOP 1030-1]
MMSKSNRQTVQMRAAKTQILSIGMAQMIRYVVFLTYFGFWNITDHGIDLARSIPQIGLELENG